MKIIIYIIKMKKKYLQKEIISNNNNNRKFLILMTQVKKIKMIIIQFQVNLKLQKTNQFLNKFPENINKIINKIKIK